MGTRSPWLIVGLAALTLSLYLAAFRHQSRLAGLPSGAEAAWSYPVRIGGFAASTPEEARRIAEVFPVGRSVSIQESDGSRGEVVLVRGRSWIELATILVSGLLYWATAVFILAPQMDRPGIRELCAGILLFGLAVAVGGVYFPRDPIPLGTLFNWIHLACLAALPLLFVLISLRFPGTGTLGRAGGAAVILLSVLAAGLVLGQGLAFHRYYAHPGAEAAGALRAAVAGGRVFLVGGVAAGFTILLVRGRKLELTRDRDLLKWLLWGFTVGLTPYVFLRQLPVLLGFDPPFGPAFDRVFELAIPLIIMVVVARYRFLDIDIIIRRSVIYGVLAAGVVAVYSVAGLLLGPRVLSLDERELGVLALTVGIAAGISFRPMRNRIAAWVDRRFFKLSHDYEVALRRLERRLDFAADPAEVARHLDDFLSRFLDPTLHAVVIVDDGLRRACGNLDGAALDRCMDAVTGVDQDSSVLFARHGTTTLPEIEDGEVPEAFTAAGIALAQRLRSPSVPGWILLGPRSTGWRYVEPDVDLVRRAASIGEGFLERMHWVRAAAQESLERQRLAEIDRMKSDFLSRVSHDLRTPLASIAWSVENLLDGIAGEISDGQAEYLRSIRVSTSHLGRLVRNLLEISRLEQGSTRLSLEPVLLGPVLESAVIALRPLATEKDVRFELESGTGAGGVMADPDKLLQVVMNLLDNAIKYSPPGTSIELVLPAAPDGRVSFTIRDHGPGLGDVAPELLFERYRQGAPSPHASGQGFGLGLYVVKSFVDLMHGDVRARTHPGGGAEFTVTLPRVDATSPEIEG